jgi:hypothetical protein
MITLTLYTHHLLWLMVAIVGFVGSVEKSSPDDAKIQDDGRQNVLASRRACDLA